MGADMIIELIIIDDDKPLDEIEADLFERIDDLEDSGDLAELFDELNVDADEFILSDDTDEIDLDFVKKYLKGIVIEAHTILREGSRDIVDFRYKGSTFFVTGGMSHGDSPDR